MTETSRVQRWREGKRKEGLKAVTIWVTTEEERRLKDLATTWHCSPSAFVQHALAAYDPGVPQSLSTEGGPEAAPRQELWCLWCGGTFSTEEDERRHRAQCGGYTRAPAPAPASSTPRRTRSNRPEKPRSASPATKRPRRLP
jgi:hypothetical protein